jgi:hypothetical protein
VDVNLDEKKSRRMVRIILSETEDLNPGHLKILKAIVELEFK